MARHGCYNRRRRDGRQRRSRCEIRDQRCPIRSVRDARESHRVAGDHTARGLQPSIQSCAVPPERLRPQGRRVAEAGHRGHFASEQSAQMRAGEFRSARLQRVTGAALEVEQPTSFLVYCGGGSGGGSGRRHRHGEQQDRHHAEADAAQERTRIKPSWAMLATRRPLRSKMLPREKPRAPEALGLSIEYSNQSSTRKSRWNHIA